MQTNTAEPMDTSHQFCPNLACSARGQIGQGNITIHDRKRQRYRCRTCGRTFSARRGTMFEGLRTSTEVVVIVVTLLAFGCPVQAIVQAYGLDERTVASWRDRAGQQCHRVHQAVVEQGRLDLVHVQAEEIRVKARGMVAWMGLAIMVSTRLWLGGVVSRTRDSSLADHLLQQVRACSQAACALPGERLATLTRKCRHAAQRLQAPQTGMYLIGSTYNFCCFHQHQSLRAVGEAQSLLRQTKALASGLTDHRWRLSELVSYKVAPAPWVEPKRRGRPRRQLVAEPSLPKRPRGRPRTRPLPDPNMPKRPQGRPRKIPLSTFTV